MEELDPIIQIILNGGEVAGGITAIGLVGWKIKKWLTSQTTQLSGELKSQHECITRVENKTDLLYERSRLAEIAHGQIASEISKIKDQKMEIFERIGKLEGKLDQHLDKNSTIS